MAERIYVMNEGGSLEPLTEKSFDTEDILQRLIADYPELLDGEQIRPRDPRRWLVVTREKGIADAPDSGNRWSVDHLMVDQDAVPTFVEVKRSSNSEIRRSVVGQMLDYAAHATETMGVAEIRRDFEANTVTMPRMSCMISCSPTRMATRMPSRTRSGIYLRQTWRPNVSGSCS